MNTVIIDNTQSKDIISSYLREIEGVNLINSYNDFDEFLNGENIYEIDLILFDITKENSDNILEKVNYLSSKNDNLNFIALSYEISSELTVKALKFEKIREFLLKPVVALILQSAIKKIKDIKNNVSKKRADTICVFSSKGAVGKTSLAINLAYNMQEISKKKVCLLDLNYGDCLTFLDMEPKFSPDYVISNIEKSDEELFFSLLDRYKNSNLYIFSTQSEISKNSHLKADDIVKIINYFKTYFSYIIIDVPPIMDEKTVEILNNCDLVLLLLVFNLISVRNTQKCFELFKNIEYSNDKVKLIVNRYTENSKITLKDIENVFEKDVFSKIPNNYLTLIDAINAGLPLEEVNPNSNIAKAYKKTAEDILNIDFEDLKNSNKLTQNYGIFNLLRRMGE